MRSRFGVILAGLAGLFFCRLLWVLFGVYIEARLRRHHLEAAWFGFALAVGATIVARTPLTATTLSVRATVIGAVGLVPLSFCLYWPALQVG